MTRKCIRRGQVEAWNPLNSDVLTMKRVLEGRSLSFLKSQTEKRYYEDRTKRLKEGRNGASDKVGNA